MTAKQKMEACILLAPNFYVTVEFTTFPTVARVMKWYGRRPADISGMSAGMSFPDGYPFDPTFDELLTRAFAALQGP